MDNKKLIQVLSIVVAAIWVFCIVLVVSYKTAQKHHSAVETTVSQIINEPTTYPMAQTTATPSSQPPLTIDGNNITTTPNVDKPQWVIDEEESIKASQEASKKAQEAASTTKAYVPSTKKEVIDAYVKAVNKLKNTSDFKLDKTENLTVEIDDITGGSTVKNIAQQLIKSNARNGTTSFSFSGSMDYRSGKSPNQVIAPLDTEAQLDEKYVKRAVATAAANGSYKVRLEFGKQTQTLDSPAPGYSTILEVIDIDSLGLTSSMTVTSLEIIYDSSYIDANIDKNGNITSMYHYITVSESNGEGRLTLIPTKVKMHGSYSCDYKVTY